MIKKKVSVQSFGILSIACVVCFMIACDHGNVVSESEGEDLQTLCVPEDQSITCGSAVCGTAVNNCDQDVVCGTCEAGEVCNNGACEDTVADPCEPDPCNDHGTCSGGTCSCDLGYAGDNCATCDTGYVGYPTCVADPCEPGGIVASRTTGVAPLAVFFSSVDALAPTTGSQVFHEWAFHWTFSDPDSGIWEETGRSKNVAAGPLAGHVFERPGTYLVSLAISRGSEAVETFCVSIQVEDPDVIFAGDKTICVSTGSDFDACPSGATHLSESSFSSAMQHVDVGRRLLFRRGETWTTSEQVTIDHAGPGTIGAWGDGDRPKINSSIGEVMQLSSSSPNFDDWRFMDLEFIGAGEGDLISAESTIRRFLALRIKASNYESVISISANKPDWHHHPMHAEVTIAECDINNINGGSGGYGVFVASEDLAVLGNRITDVRDGEHNLRIQHARRAVVADNYIAHSAATKHVLKMHSECSAETIRQSEYFVIANNTFVGADNPWTVSIGPQSARYDEMVRIGLIEGNHFVAGPGTQVALHHAVTDVTVRNNVFDMTDSAWANAVRVIRRGIEPLPTDNRIYHNTCYTADSVGHAVCVDVTETAVDTAVINNLLAAPNADAASVVSDDGSGTYSSGNLAMDDPAFVSESPSAASDFALSAGSNAVDNGAWIGSACGDFFGNPRCVDGNGDGEATCDVGAFELQP